jgi:hypothetical protein
MMASLVLARGGMPVTSGLHFSRRPNTAAANARTSQTEAEGSAFRLQVLTVGLTDAG